MLKLSDIVIDELGIKIKDIDFEEGKTYGIDSVDTDFNDIVSELLRGYYMPDGGGLYLTVTGVTNNLINVDDDYLHKYNKSCVYIDKGVYLVEDLSIKDNMLLLHRGKRGLSKANIDKILKMVHLTDVQKVVKDLDVNDRYRVRLAQILYMRPKVVITNMLFKDIMEDVYLESLEDIESLLCDICKYTGATLIYMGDIINRSNFDIVLDKSNMVEVM